MKQAGHSRPKQLKPEMRYSGQLQSIILKLVGGLMLLTMQTAYAQPVAVNPVPQPAHQAIAPGLAYTPDQMWRRLMAIAEGPIPTREALEKEFGFTFRYFGQPPNEPQGNGDYFGAAASPPFGTPQPPRFKNISHYTLGETTLIAFHFDPKWQGINATEDRYCVENEHLFKALTGKWVRSRRERWHSPIEVDYSATFNRITRVVTVAPLDISASSYPCLKTFYIDYTHPTTGTKK